MQYICWFAKLSWNCLCNKSVSYSFIPSLQNSTSLIKTMIFNKQFMPTYSRKAFGNYLLIVLTFHLCSLKRFPYKNVEGLRQTFNFFFLHKLHPHFTLTQDSVRSCCVAFFFFFFYDVLTHSTAILSLLTEKKVTSSTGCTVTFWGNGAKICFVDKTRQFCRPLCYIDLTL